MGNPLNRKPGLFISFFIAIVVIGFVLRFQNLAQRPMHTDEAVHAVKFGTLLEDHEYTYDPQEFHGPALNYFTLIPAWLSSANTIFQINETTLRIIPVLFGMLLIISLFLLRDSLGRSTVLLAGLLLALSPAMVFYSRYYIQEILLVFFTFGVIVSGYRYLESPRVVWAFLIGIFLGLMHATKETCIIAFGAMFLAFIITWAISFRNGGLLSTNIRKINPYHIAIIIGSAVVISVLFYSSFFTNPQGILDSFLTYKYYFYKAGHSELQNHSWFYYFKLLAFSKSNTGQLWSEAIILLLAGLCIIVKVKRLDLVHVNSDLLWFIILYTLFSSLFYSVIPYKTPWSMLGFYHGLIIMAAVGSTSIPVLITNKKLRFLCFFLLIVGIGDITVQSYLSCTKYDTDPSNPYVHSHTTRDIFKITDRIQEIAKIHPDGIEMFIEVVSPGSDYWPLPWYLRSFPNVGWYTEVDFSNPAAQVIVAAPEVETDLLKKIYEMPPPGEKHLYLPLFEFRTELRPNVEIRGYIAKDLWDMYQQSLAGTPEL